MIFMGKRYFFKRETARKFARKVNREVHATSSIWQRKNKTRRWKIYLVKY